MDVFKSWKKKVTFSLIKLRLTDECLLWRVCNWVIYGIKDTPIFSRKKIWLSVCGLQSFPPCFFLTPPPSDQNGKAAPKAQRKQGWWWKRENKWLKVVGLITYVRESMCMCECLTRQSCVYINGSRKSSRRKYAQALNRFTATVTKHSRLQKCKCLL